MIRIDTSGTIEIAGPSQNILIILILCFVGVTLGAACLLIPPGKAAFFGMGLIVLSVSSLFAAFTKKGSIITITPEGIRDTRVSNKLVPWRVVKSISIWNTKLSWGPLHIAVTGSYNGKNIIVLAITPEDIRKLEMPQILAQGRGLNRETALDGLCLTSDGLKIDFETLLELCTAFWDASKNSETGVPAAKSM